MIDWGADIIFGSHPHVVEPSETDLDRDKILSFNRTSSNQQLRP